MKNVRKNVPLLLLVVVFTFGMPSSSSANNNQKGNGTDSTMEKGTYPAKKHEGDMLNVVVGGRCARKVGHWIMWNWTSLNVSFYMSGNLRRKRSYANKVFSKAKISSGQRKPGIEQKHTGNCSGI